MRIVGSVRKPIASFIGVSDVDQHNRGTITVHHDAVEQTIAISITIAFDTTTWFVQLCVRRHILLPTATDTPLIAVINLPRRRLDPKHGWTRLHIVCTSAHGERDRADQDRLQGVSRGPNYRQTRPRRRGVAGCLGVMGTIMCMGPLTPRDRVPVQGRVEGRPYIGMVKGGAYWHCTVRGIRNRADRPNFKVKSETIHLHKATETQSRIPTYAVHYDIIAIGTRGDDLSVDKLLSLSPRDRPCPRIKS